MLENPFPFEYIIGLSPRCILIKLVAAWVAANHVITTTSLFLARAFSLSVLKRVYSYLSRAKEYDTGTYEKDDKPVCGTISYNLWGGDAMLNWSERKLKQIEE